VAAAGIVVVAVVDVAAAGIVVVAVAADVADVVVLVAASGTVVVLGLFSPVRLAIAWSPSLPGRLFSPFGR